MSGTENRSLAKNYLKTLRDSCFEGLDGTWDCSTEEGRKGFNDMIEVCNDLAKVLKINLDDYSYVDSLYVCAHEVNFYFNGNIKPEQDTEELKTLLLEEAETRVKSQIIENYSQGELNYETEDIQLRGWWTIGCNHKKD